MFLFANSCSQLLKDDLTIFRKIFDGKERRMGDVL